MSCKWLGMNCHKSRKAVRWSGSSRYRRAECGPSDRRSSLYPHCYQNSPTSSIRDVVSPMGAPPIFPTSRSPLSSQSDTSLRRISTNGAWAELITSPGVISAQPAKAIFCSPPHTKCLPTLKVPTCEDISTRWCPSSAGPPPLGIKLTGTPCDSGVREITSLLGHTRWN